MDGPFTSVLKLMSEDLPRFCEIVQTDYDNRNNLSTGEMNHLISTNTALKSEYSRAGLSQPTAYFWTEYYKGSNDYDIGNLIKTKWHQDYPYNILNPLMTNSNTEHQPAGCVTLAVAQILNFYKYPQTLRRRNGLFFSTLDVDWSKTDIPYFTDPDLLDIPTLIQFVNQGVFTENGDTGSSSNIDHAQSFFVLNQYVTRKYDGRDISRMISEIKVGRPVYVRGSSNSPIDFNGFNNNIKLLTIEKQ